MSDADHAVMLKGCGKFFEGSGEEMHKALNETLAALPDETRVFVSQHHHGLPP